MGQDWYILGTKGKDRPLGKGSGADPPACDATHCTGEVIKLEIEYGLADAQAAATQTSGVQLV